ncbi:MAG: glycosyltransferase family 2 protein [Methylocystis sp.]|nr:glycosyltransferase family 2 protein [Methylocystis sp.]MCA3583300.1 glycosyltransferase family 2 protein [Methylocystis sp.]MCA3588085.1 glycosyltransferase family 2 protein [Methylocystis sp.]MCA3591473.1 glycosyltransferase family 2 protein [Methylocystis sp.]
MPDEASFPKPSLASPPELTVVIPVFNEEANAPLIAGRLTAVLQGCVASHELLFIDDGSRDGTLAVIRDLAQKDGRIRCLSFSRNFGKDVALAAGLDHARGDAVVMIDADLQHPPESIPALVAKWREGFDMVYGQRTDRTADGKLYSRFARRFYEVFQRFGEVPLPEGAGDFRLISRRVVEQLRRMPERARFSKGLYAWVGFRQTGVPYEVAPRAHGETKWNYAKLFRFAFDGLTSFSTVPLRLATYTGVAISVLAFLYAFVTILRTLVFGADVPGFPSIIVSVMFFSGIQLIFLGIIGEYIGRIFAEVKERPLYIVAEELGGGPLPAAAPGTKTGAPRVRSSAKRS